RGKLWLLSCLREGGVYDLRRRRGVALQVEQRKQSALLGAHAGQTGGCGMLPLALPAWVNDEGFLNSTQLFQNAVEAQFLTLTGQFPLVARKSARAPRRSRRRAPGFWSRSSDTSGSIPGNGDSSSAEKRSRCGIASDKPA